MCHRLFNFRSIKGTRSFFIWSLRTRMWREVKMRNWAIQHRSSPLIAQMNAHSPIQHRIRNLWCMWKCHSIQRNRPVKEALKVSMNTVSSKTPLILNFWLLSFNCLLSLSENCQKIVFQERLFFCDFLMLLILMVFYSSYPSITFSWTKGKTLRVPLCLINWIT